MSDKTIAEIIGWVEDGGDTQYLPFYAKSDGTYGHGEPDCDDMLAWLWQNTCPDCFYVFTECYQVNGPSVDTWCCALPDGSEWPDDLKRPTLHAALEAAVRAVHDAEEAQ